MPLSFATILGGMITLIGTPPNIVIAAYRQEALGEPFGMLDFAPVGLAVALVGITFVALVGWRLLPERGGHEVLAADGEAGRYVAELRVGDKVAETGSIVADLYPLADEHDVNILGLVRGGRRQPGFARRAPVRPGDFIVIEGDPRAIEAFMGQASLEFAGSEKHESGVASESLALSEAIVPEGARIAGRTARDLQLLFRHSVTLLGVARGGAAIPRPGAPADHQTGRCAAASGHARADLGGLRLAGRAAAGGPQDTGDPALKGRACDRAVCPGHRPLDRRRPFASHRAGGLALSPTPGSGWSAGRRFTRRSNGR